VSEQPATELLTPELAAPELQVAEPPAPEPLTAEQGVELLVTEQPGVEQPTEQPVRAASVLVAWLEVPQPELIRVEQARSDAKLELRGAQEAKTSEATKSGCLTRASN